MRLSSIEAVFLLGCLAKVNIAKINKLYYRLTLICSQIATFPGGDGWEVGWGKSKLKLIPAEAEN